MCIHTGELYDFDGPRGVSPSSEHGRSLAQGYAAAVAFVDVQVGRVLGALRRLGGENATLTVLRSDHEHAHPMHACTRASPHGYGTCTARVRTQALAAAARRAAPLITLDCLLIAS